MIYRAVRPLLIILTATLLACLACCAKPAVAVSVSNDKIEQGQQVKVSWTSQHAKNVTLDGEKVDKDGSKVFTPPSTTTYTAVAFRGKKEASDHKTVSVNARPARPTISISGDPNSITKGQSTTLRWSSANADRVTISGLGDVRGSGSRSVSPDQSTTYTATATGPGGSDTAAARITVGEPVSSARPTQGTNASLLPIFNENVRQIFFDYDRAELRPDAKATLRHSADWLIDAPYQSIVFRIEGNCDPRGTEEYNIGLGERRAEAAKEFLISLGVDQSRIRTVSNGKEKAAGTREGSSDHPPSWAYDRNDTFVYVSGELHP